MSILWEQLKAYGQSSCYPYHMPGHKGNSFGQLPKALAEMDITEIDGFDNLHDPQDLFCRLQKEAADLYGAEESFYLVNGSTCGILSAISAALPRGGHLLMARNSHKSAYHGAYLRNLKISYLHPPIMEAYDICDAVTPDQVRRALEKEPDIGAVFLVSPTYEGRIADIQAIAEVVHERKIPLIVDEAHGAHLGMAEGFAENSCQAGADVVIHSVHKTLPALTQTALLHVNGDRICRDKLRRFLHIYQTSSPSYVLMASIDNALQGIIQDKDTLFTEWKARYTEMMNRLKACRYLQFFPLEEGKQDIGKLVISGKRAGISGQKIYDFLREKYQLQLEMASASFCLAMFTMADGEEAYSRMVEALLEVDRKIGEGIFLSDAEPFSVTDLFREREQIKLPFAEAWDQESIFVELEQAAGKCAGDFVNLYPPGIPLLVPGESFTTTHCRYLAEYLGQGLNVQGVRTVKNTDGKECYQVRILKNKEAENKDQKGYCYEED